MTRGRKPTPAFRITSYALPDDWKFTTPSRAVTVTKAEWQRIAGVASVLYTGTDGLPFLYEWDVSDVHKRQLVRHGNRLFLVERV